MASQMNDFRFYVAKRCAEERSGWTMNFETLCFMEVPARWNSLILTNGI